MRVREIPQPHDFRRAKAETLTSIAPDLNAAIEGTRLAGLLDGERSEHVSFRVPKALLDAAKERTGATSLTELGMIALAVVAQPDPVVEHMKANWGKLGKGHRLDY